MKERIYSPSPAPCPCSYCFSDFSSPFSQLFDYASYYCRISCVFSLSTLSTFYRSIPQLPPAAQIPASFFRRWFSDFSRFFEPFFFSPFVSPLFQINLHKNSHKNLLRRVVHTFHKVFHIAFSRNFNETAANIPSSPKTSPVLNVPFPRPEVYIKYPLKKILCPRCKLLLDKLVFC